MAPQTQNIPKVSIIFILRRKIKMGRKKGRRRRGRGRKEEEDMREEDMREENEDHHHPMTRIPQGI